MPPFTILFPSRWRPAPLPHAQHGASILCFKYCLLGEEMDAWDATCWLESPEAVVVGLEMVREATKQVRYIQSRLKTAQDRQKSYADVRRRELEFNIGEHVYLKVSPIKGVVRFKTTGKLKPRYIGPFQILERVGKLAYRLALSPSLAGVHNVFHVSMLKKYVRDDNHIITDFKDLEIQPDTTYIEKPMKILHREEKVLRNKIIPLVKVMWNNHGVEECTWEREDDMMKDHPHLFDM